MSSELIARLDKWLSANRADYYAKLRPGVTPADLDAFEQKFNLTLPAEFRELYLWRDGGSSYQSLVENMIFPPLHEIVESKETFDGMIGEDFEDPKWWRRGWVPFLNNGGGDHLCIDLVAEDGGVPGQLLTFYHDDADRPIESPSMEAWLTKLVETMESGKLEVY